MAVRSVLLGWLAGLIGLLAQQQQNWLQDKIKDETKPDSAPYSTNRGTNEDEP